MACKYSVIIPVYQVKPYIEKCLDSIMSQVPADVQVILIDDGSTDGSGEICDQYAQRYPQIEVTHQKNQGVAAARNTGLRASRGEYLLWVDPDDWVADKWFTSIDHVVSSQNVDIALFDYVEYENDGTILRTYGREAGLLEPSVFLNDIVRDIRINNSLWNKVFRRSLFDDLVFDEKLKCLEDYDLIHQCILKASSIYYIQLPLYCYLIRERSLVRAYDLDVSYQSYLVAQKRRAELERNGIQCDPMGCVLQAKEYCRNYYLSGKPVQRKKTFQECQRYVIRHFFNVISEKEISLKRRIKWLFLMIPFVGNMYAFMSRGDKAQISEDY